MRLCFVELLCLPEVLGQLKVLCLLGVLVLHVVIFKSLPEVLGLLEMLCFTEVLYFLEVLCLPEVLGLL